MHYSKFKIFIAPRINVIINEQSERLYSNCLGITNRKRLINIHKNIHFNPFSTRSNSVPTKLENFSTVFPKYFRVRKKKERNVEEAERKCSRVDNTPAALYDPLPRPFTPRETVARACTIYKTLISCDEELMDTLEASPVR